MGYAGYVPTKYAQHLTPTQQALRAVANEASFELMSKVIRNVVVNPADDKFRRLRLSNAKVAAALTKVPGAVEAMLALGWIVDPADEDFLVCPKGAKPSMAQVRLIDDAKAAFKKEQRDAKRSAASKQLAEEKGGEAVRITAQLAADRAERSARGPVEQGSKAQALPQSSGIRTAGDAGLNSGGCNC